LSANAGERLVLREATRTTDVRFGQHLVPRQYLELDERRISPLSLRKSDHHRLAWMNLLLPYCPESLEQLTSACTLCEATLGWHYAKGIGVCEHCGREVARSVEPPLREELADDYRLFARLSSPDTRSVAEAMASMPSSLRSATPSSLVRLALQFGGLVQTEPVIAKSRVVIVALPKPLLGSIATAGTALLRSWPTSVQSWVEQRSEELRGDPEEFWRLRSRLQRLTQRGTEPDDVVKIVEEALPDLRRHAVHAFSSSHRYYLYKDVQKLLGLDAPQIDALRERPEITYRRTTRSSHRKGQFDADQIDHLASIFRWSVPFNSCTGTFKLPLYAIEQCCRPGVLVREDHPAYFELKSQTSVRPDSLEALVAGLACKRSRQPLPSRAVSLSVASKRIGGRLKPWGSIIQALLDGAIEFWLADERPTTKSIFVRAGDFAVFDKVVDTPSDYGIETSPIVSQADVAEILNIKSGLLPHLSAIIGVPFIPDGRALVAQRLAVLAAAGGIAWDTEISWHLGVSFREVEDILSARDIEKRAGGGWRRRQLIDAGILPTKPE
jgi:hypothetical protein